MGTIAARDALRVLELTEQVAAALLIAARQGLTLRQRIDPELKLTAALAAMQRDLEERIPLLAEDRALDKELHMLIAAIHHQVWDLYAN